MLGKRETGIHQTRVKIIQCAAESATVITILFFYC